MKASHKAPPLILWAVLAVVIISMALAWSFLAPWTRNYIIGQQAEDYLTDDSPPREGLLMLALGSSSTKRALEVSNEFWNEQHPDNSSPIFFKKISPDSSGLQDVFSKSINSVVLSAKPNIVFIDANMVFFDNHARNLANIRKRIRTMSTFRYIRRHLTGYWKTPDSLFEYPRSTRMRVLKPPEVEEEAQERFYGRWNICEYEDNRVLNEYLAKIATDETKVIILGLPFHPELDEMIYADSRKERILQLISRYEKEHGVDYWRFPHDLSTEQFSDVTHLNMKGRASVSKWLRERILEHQLNLREDEM